MLTDVIRGSYDCFVFVVCLYFVIGKKMTISLQTRSLFKLSLLKAILARELITNRETDGPCEEDAMIRTQFELLRCIPFIATEERKS
jgi:hypothetical protein